MRRNLFDDMCRTFKGVWNMTASNLSKQYGMAAISFGLVGVIIYLLMINVTLAHIEGVSGQVPFDMRPFGYGQL